jgi:hypothetical protein
MRPTDVPYNQLLLLSETPDGKFTTTLFGSGKFVSDKWSPRDYPDMFRLCEGIMDQAGFWASTHEVTRVTAWRRKTMVSLVSNRGWCTIC